MCFLWIIRGCGRRSRHRRLDEHETIYIQGRLRLKEEFVSHNTKREADKSPTEKLSCGKGR